MVDWPQGAQEPYYCYLANFHRQPSKACCLKLSRSRWHVPWTVIVGALGFLAAWLVVAVMEYTGLSRYVWHLPLFFVGLVVLFSSLIGLAVSP